MKKRNLRLLGIVWLGFVTFWAYAGVTHNEFIRFDDDRYVTHNQEVQQGLSTQGVVWAFTTTRASNWHPLTWLSHMLDIDLYGLHPAGHHRTSLQLHLLNAVLLFLVLEKLTTAMVTSLGVAALFALHPLHVESVAWVAERKDVLSGLFFMLTVGLYAGWVERRGRVRYLGVSCALVAGLLSKPMLVTLPAVLLLLDFWPLRRPIRLRVRVLEKLPWVALSVISSLVTLAAHRHAGTLPGFESFSFPARAANALLSYTVYLEKLFWPSSLAVYYPYRDALSAGPLLAAGMVLLMVSVGVMGVRRRFPYLLVGWLWYLGMLVPVIGLVQVGGQALADRYTYLPSIGIFLAIGFGFSDLVKSQRVPHALAGFLALAGLAGLAWCSHVQVGYWKNTTTLFEHTLQVTRPNLLAHVVLGNQLSHAGRFDAAIVEFKQAAAIDPNSALARNNIGVAYRRSGNLAQAARWFRQAIRADTRYAKAHYNLGGVLQRQKRFGAAARAYARAIEQDPEFLDAHSNLGIVLLQLGQPQQALHEFRKAVQIAPDSANANYNLGNALLILGHVDQAIGLLQEAVRLDPAHPLAQKRLRAARSTRLE